MTPRQIIINSLNKTLKLIKTGKYFFIILFFTQLLFTGIMATIFVYYAIDIGAHAQTILEPLQEIASEEDILSMLSSINIHQEYKAMMTSVAMFLIFAYLAYIILNGINWDLTNMVITKKCKCFFYLTRFAILAFVFLLPLLIILNLLTKFFISTGVAISIAPILLIIALVTFYFMHISFSMIDQWKEIKQIKEILKKTFRLGIKQAKVIIPTYVFALFSLIVTLALLFAALEAPFLLLFAASILFIITINWARLYFLVTMRELI